VLGLQVGDELLVLNGLVISQLDMVYVEALLDELDAISLTVRSCRTVDRACPALSSPPSDELADTPSTQPMWMQPSGKQTTPGNFSTPPAGAKLPTLNFANSHPEINDSSPLFRRVTIPIFCYSDGPIPNPNPKPQTLT